MPAVGNVSLFYLFALAFVIQRQLAYLDKPRAEVMDMQRIAAARGSTFQRSRPHTFIKNLSHSQVLVIT